MLEVNSLSYEIQSENNEPVALLSEISMKIPRGHFMAIVGSSGCGKTTLLKTIAGLFTETSGTVLWDGRDLAQEQDLAPNEVGYVPQFSIAYEQLTVDENIEVAARLRMKFPSADALDDCIDKLLEATGLTELADRSVSVLSGGQKRRLALAMELVSSPDLLLCDEVTSGLDPRSEKEIVHMLHAISRQNERIVISVTHSLAHVQLYDSVLVLHEGRVAFHGPPGHLGHYFGVSNFEEIYPQLVRQSAENWQRSWEKHRSAYYPTEVKQAVPAENLQGGDPEGVAGILPVSTEEAMPVDSSDSEKQTRAFVAQEIPGLFSQFWVLLCRRWKIFFRDKTQLGLQLTIILLFPILVSLFSSKGQEPINKLTAQRDQNVFQEIEQRKMVEQNHVGIGSAVSGIIMFEVILLALMGSNNAAREIASERQILEKEKYAGLRPGAYLASKLGFLSVLVLVQSSWMFFFVEYFWKFRGEPCQHFLFLLLVNAAVTSICLGISALSKTAEQASLLSIYLVGFQLPLSGAVLALPGYLEPIVRPFISAYWAWAGSLSALEENTRAAVRLVVETSLLRHELCLYALGMHVLLGIVLAYLGLKRHLFQ